MMRRIIWAEAANKWARSRQGTFLASIRVEVSLPETPDIRQTARIEAKQRRKLPMQFGVGVASRTWALRPLRGRDASWNNYSDWHSRSMSCLID
jgi:hypothetical protein